MPSPTSRPALSPTARRLLAGLRVLAADAPTTATNAELAHHAGVSPRHPRTVPAALRQLEAAGLITTTRTAPHPTGHPSGRWIALTTAGRQEVAR